MPAGPEWLTVIASIGERLLGMYADGKGRRFIDREKLMDRREELALIREAKLRQAKAKAQKK